MPTRKKIKAGTFVPRKSVIHKLDARAKILFFLLFVIVIFAVTNWIALVVCAALLVALILVAKINIFSLVRSVLPLLIGFLIVAYLNVFFIQTGVTVFEWNFIHIYSDGILRSNLYAVRLVLTLVAGAFLLACTSQMQFTEGLGKLLAPLQKLGVPVQELSFVLALALRFVPVLSAEVQQVMVAQRLRGAHFTTGNLKSRLQAIVSLVMPVTVGAIRKAEALSFALLSKNFVAGAPRTEWDYEGYLARQKNLQQNASTRV